MFLHYNREHLTIQSRTEVKIYITIANGELKSISIFTLQSRTESSHHIMCSIHTVADGHMLTTLRTDMFRSRAHSSCEPSGCAVLHLAILLTRDLTVGSLFARTLLSLRARAQSISLASGCFAIQVTMVRILSSDLRSFACLTSPPALFQRLHTVVRLIPVSFAQAVLVP